MGGIEIAAALLGVINVLLVVRRSIWNYPFGIAMVSLYFSVFWESKLYSDALLQIFFLLIQLYGWWAWRRASTTEGVPVGWMTTTSRWRVGIIAAIAILAWGSGMARFTDAAAPMIDGTIAGMSVTAQILQSVRRVESWILWIAVDVMSIGLFAWRGLSVTAALYALFLVLAVLGFAEWKRTARA